MTTGLTNAEDDRINNLDIYPAPNLPEVAPELEVPDLLTARVPLCLLEERFFHFPTSASPTSQSAWCQTSGRSTSTFPTVCKNDKVNSIIINFGNCDARSRCIQNRLIIDQLMELIKFCMFWWFGCLRRWLAIESCRLLLIQLRASIKFYRYKNDSFIEASLRDNSTTTGNCKSKLCIGPVLWVGGFVSKFFARLSCYLERYH